MGPLFGGLIEAGVRDRLQNAKLKEIPEWERRARIGSRRLMESQMQRKKDGGAIEESMFDDAPPAINPVGQVEMF